METLRTGDGRTLAYDVVGTGPTLVCHPGGPGFAGAEVGDLGGLSATRTLVLLDPRGTGGSDKAPGYSVDGYAADIDELRAHLGLERIDLLGFSHGAIIAIHYAARYPDRLSRLVLAGGLAAFTEEAKAFADETIASKAGEPWYADAVAALAEEESGAEVDLAALFEREAPLYFAHWDERYRSAIRAGSIGASGAPLLEFNQAGFDVRGELADITAPTLVVTGAADFVCGPPAGEVLERGIANSRMVMLKDTGHMMFLEQPDAFKSAVEAFLQHA